MSSVEELIKALVTARDHIKQNHKATAWHNDPAAWKIITEVIEPAIKKSRSPAVSNGVCESPQQEN